MKQNVEVMGTKITLQVSTKDPTYAQKVAKYVDMTAQPIEQGLPGVTREQLAVMTALELADQLFRLNDGEKRTTARLTKAIKKIEKGLAK